MWSKPGEALSPGTFNTLQWKWVPEAGHISNRFMAPGHREYTALLKVTTCSRVAEVSSHHCQQQHGQRGVGLTGAVFWLSSSTQKDTGLSRQKIYIWFIFFFKFPVVGMWWKPAFINGLLVRLQLRFVFELQGQLKTLCTHRASGLKENN